MLSSLRPAPRPALPSLCAVCHGWAATRLCGDCIAVHAPSLFRCRRCAIECPESVALCGDCQRSPPAFDGCVAALRYDFPWDGLITAFKYHAALDLAAGLARRLDAAIDAAALPPPDRIVPVPLARERLAERGYNQAWELARRLAPRRGVRAEPRLLLRLRGAPPQAGLSLERRAANLRGAFLVEPGSAGSLHGATVAVVDDVMTSGSTLQEAARALKQAGAASVQAWVLARTPKPKPKPKPSPEP